MNSSPPQAAAPRPEPSNHPDSSFPAAELAPLLALSTPAPGASLGDSPGAASPVRPVALQGTAAGSHTHGFAALLLPRQMGEQQEAGGSLIPTICTPLAGLASAFSPAFSSPSSRWCLPG